MREQLEGPDGLIELTVPLEAKMNLGIVTDFDADKLDREKWLWKYGYKPYRALMSDEELFGWMDVSGAPMAEVAAAVGEGDYARARVNLLEAVSGRMRASAWRMFEPVPPDRARVLEQAAPYMNGEPVSLEQKAFPYELAAAYEATGDGAYLSRWLELFDGWYATSRPPAGTPTVFISCHFINNPWETLITGHQRFKHLAQMEHFLRGCPLDTGTTEPRINLYKSLIEHGQFLASMNQVFHPNNWQVHQLEGLLDVSLQFPEFRESAAWAQLSLKWLGEHIRRETLEDGGHHERCTAYNAGVIMEYRQTLEMIRRAGLEPPEGFVENLRKMYDHQVYLYAPGLAQVGIGDGGNTGPNSGLDLMIDGALSFHIPECKWFADKHPERVQRAAERLHGEGADEALTQYEQVAAREPERTSKLLPDAGWAVMRSSWEDDALYMITDYGSNVPWHTHPDFLGFSIFAHGRPLITDTGLGGTQGYQSDVRKKWCKQTISHNTVLIDGMSQEKFHEGACHRWVDARGFDYLHVSHPGYRFLGVEHARRILFVKPEYWIVTDALRVGEFVTTSGYHEYEWLAHFQPAELEVGSDSSIWARTEFGAHIGMIPINPDRMTLRQDTGFMSAPESGVEDAPVVSLVQEGEPPVDFGVVLFPFRGEERPRVSVTAMEAQEGDMGCRIQIGGDVSDLYLENRSDGLPHRFGEVLFDGEVGWIREGSEARLFLVGASLLAKDGAILFTCNERVGWVAVSFQKGVLELFSDAVRQMTIWSPEAREVRFNGKPTAFVRSGEYVILESV